MLEQPDQDSAAESVARRVEAIAKKLLDDELANVSCVPTASE